MNELIKAVTNELPTLKAIISLNASHQNDADVETIVRQELQYLEQIAFNNEEILKVEPITALMAIKSVMKKNLTLDPAAGLVYASTRNYKVVEGGRDVWKKALEIIETANGQISVARQCGTLLDVDRPTVQKDATGRVISVTFRYLVPSVDPATGGRAARWKEVEFDESDFERWQKYSHKEKRRAYDNKKPEYRGNMAAPDDVKLNYANPLYTSWRGGIDPEFARAKAIKHGLKKLGTNPNESRATRVEVPAQKIVDTAAAIAAETDNYIPHEDVAILSSNSTVETVDLSSVDL